MLRFFCSGSGDVGLARDDGLPCLGEIKVHARGCV